MGGGGWGGWLTQPPSTHLRLGQGSQSESKVQPLRKMPQSTEGVDSEPNPSTTPLLNTHLVTTWGQGTYCQANEGLATDHVLPKVRLSDGRTVKVLWSAGAHFSTKSSQWGPRGPASIYWQQLKMAIFAGHRVPPSATQQFNKLFYCRLNLKLHRQPNNLLPG